MAKRVVETVRRGVTVTIVTSWSSQDLREAMQPNNVSDDRGTAREMFDWLRDEPAAAARLRFCWFIGDRKERSPTARATADDWSHVKALVVDRAIAIIGSSNMDAQSLYHSREENLMIDDAPTARSMLGALLSRQQSLEHCHGYLDDF